MKPHFKNAIHKELAEYAAIHLNISFDTMKDVVNEKFAPKLFTFYYYIYNSHFFFICHPSKSCLFYKEIGKEVEYLQTKHVARSSIP
jgi:hypothetical protein